MQAKGKMIAWSGSMLIGSFIGIADSAAGGGAIGLLVYIAPWVAGGALLGYLAADWVATEALKNLTLQGQVREFYDAYGDIILAPMVILFLKWSLQNNNFGGELCK